MPFLKCVKTFQNFRWGYACCHSLVKNSYCTGEEGKLAFAETERLKRGADLASAADEDTVEVPKQIAWQNEERLKEHVPNEVESDSKEKRNVQEDAERRKRTIDEMRELIS